MIATPGAISVVEPDFVLQGVENAGQRVVTQNGFLDT